MLLLSLLLISYAGCLAYLMHTHLYKPGVVKSREFKENFVSHTVQAHHLLLARVELRQASKNRQQLMRDARWENDTVQYANAANKLVAAWSNVSVLSVMRYKI